MQTFGHALRHVLSAVFAAARWSLELSGRTGLLRMVPRPDLLRHMSGVLAIQTINGQEPLLVSRHDLSLRSTLAHRELRLGGSACYAGSERA